MQAKATESNVINQPFASRSSDGWRSQTLTRGGRKIGEVAGGHETTASAMPAPHSRQKKIVGGSPPQSEMWRDAAHRLPQSSSPPMTPKSGKFSAAPVQVTA
jgi:hypothetical protein